MMPNEGVRCEKHHDNISGLVDKEIEDKKNAQDGCYPKIHMEAAKLVLSTAAVKDSMREKKAVNEGEETLMRLGEAMGVVSKGWGIRKRR